MFQSLAWMTNRRAMVVGYQRERARDCATCPSFCDHICPMRLKPRTIKRLMFACTQCGQCIYACHSVQRDNPNGGLLTWIADQQALQAEGAEGLLTNKSPAAPTRISAQPLQAATVIPVSAGTNSR